MISEDLHFLSLIFNFQISCWIDRNNCVDECLSPNQWCFLCHGTLSGQSSKTLGRRQWSCPGLSVLCLISAQKWNRKLRMPRLLWKGIGYLFHPLILLKVFFLIFLSFWPWLPYLPIFFSKVIVLSFSLYIIGVNNEKMQILINSAGIKILIYFQFGWWLGDDLLQVYRLWQELHQVSEIKSW